MNITNDWLELAEAEELNNEVLRLCEEGNFNGALHLARCALAISENALGLEHRVMEPLKGTTMETLGSEIVCTKLEWIAARCAPRHAANP